MADRSPFFGLARIFHELPSRDRETGNPLAGLNGAQRARIRRACHRATAGSWIRGALEQYVAGSDTRGRPEGRSYPRSQQAIHETSGLAVKGVAPLLTTPMEQPCTKALYNTNTTKD